MAAVLEGPDAGFEVLLVRVWIDIGKDRPAETGIFEDIERSLGDCHRGKATVGDEQRLLDAEAFTGVGQFRDAAPAELDRCRIAPVCGDVAAHAVTFFRWKDFGRVRLWKPMIDSEPPRPVSLTPVQQSAGSR